MHRDDDMVDENLFVCRMCDLFFRASSMHKPALAVCRVCFDRANLNVPRRWLVLSSKNIEKLSFSDVLSKVTV